MYYFSELNVRGNHAGTKARNDTESILRAFGATPLNKDPFVLNSREDESIYSNVGSRLDLIPYFTKAALLKNEYVFIQYPMLAFDWTEKYFDTLSKKNKIVLLIHDLHSLRRGDMEAFKEEIRIINKADTVVLHNRFMKEKLIALGLTVSKIYCLEVFDYLCDAPILKENSNAIAFAGNLTKSKFLYKMFEANPEVAFHVYGNRDERLSLYENVRYFGSFLPDDLPRGLNGKFGLVWDGESIDGCSGTFGEYTRINNPHKLSLYIASGLPVIVWKKAAIAEFVEKNGIGIVTDTVSNLKEFLQIGETDYRGMQSNIQKLRADVVSGTHLSRILEKIEGINS